MVPIFVRIPIQDKERLSVRNKKPKLVQTHTAIELC